MDERLLFDKFHEALDADPRPAAYERLRSALIAKTSTPRRRAAFQMRWTRMGFRLAAAFIVLATTLAAVAAFLATHRVAERPTPADPQVAAYMELMASDEAQVHDAESNSCTEVVDASCPAAVARLNTAFQHWLDDLTRFRTPARYATIDGQSRQHLNAAITLLNRVVAAQQRSDAPGMASALLAASDQLTWLENMVSSIKGRHTATAAGYLAAVRAAKSTFDACSACQALITEAQPDCGPPYPSCVEAPAVAIERVQDSLLVNPAPDALKANDARLQTDLAEADNAVIALTAAMLSSDSARFNAGRATFRQAMMAIDQDLNAIIGG